MGLFHVPRPLNVIDSKCYRILISFLCLFHRLGMGTSSARSSSSTDYYSRGDAVPGIWIDGMDVLAVKSATDFAIKYVNEVGPIVLEVVTYR